MKHPGIAGTSEAANSGAGFLSMLPPLPDPGASSLPRGEGDLSAVPSAESTAEADDGQATRNSPAASTATGATATRTTKKQLATCNRCPENEPSRTNGRTRWKRQRIPGRDAGDVPSTAAKVLSEASRRASGLLATVEEPTNGSIGKHRQDVGSKLQSYSGVRDSINRKL